MNQMQRLRSLIGLAAAILLTACASDAAPPSTSVPLEDQYIDEYLIGIGDSLKVDVYKNPDVSTTVTVRPDGKVTIPVAGEVFVGSRTPESVADIITERLAEYIRDPIVTVTVEGMGSSEYVNRVRITGAVGSPSSQPFRTGMTVLDVVLEAGGVTEFAASSKTLIYRKGSEPLKVRLDRILKAGDMSTNYELKPGDIITVPERIF
jgi:polysaccharide export outer membrane protein